MEKGVFSRKKQNENKKEVKNRLDSYITVDEKTKVFYFDQVLHQMENSLCLTCQYRSVTKQTTREYVRLLIVHRMQGAIEVNCAALLREAKDLCYAIRSGSIMRSIDSIRRASSIVHSTFCAAIPGLHPSQMLQLGWRLDM